MENYTERLEGPDGQYVVLLTRLPYDRAFMVEAEATRRGDLAEWSNACLKAHLWEAKVTDYLTGEDAEDDVDRGDPALITEWRKRAVELYLAWRKQAFPKGAARARSAKESSAS